jgi:LDH2 family malate/lactate/ureidoglycolate dehydrogenase
MAARYPMQLAAHGLIGFTTTNTPPVMPAPGSASVVIGNNPLAWAFPRRAASPIVLDMAISAAARGKVRLAASEGKPIPLGWAVDAAGNSTQDAAEALKGWLLPVGGAKGYGLGVVNELLAGALSGARVLSEISTRTIVVGDLHDDWGVGHFLMAIDPTALLPLDEYHSRTEEIVRLLTSQRRLDGESVMLPGDPETHAATVNEELGIPLPQYVLEAMDQLADTLRITRLSRRNS